MSSNRKLLFRPYAEDDLELIYTYTESAWGYKQAENYIERLYQSMTQLLKYPEARSIYQSQTIEYRKIIVDHHIIYYRCLETEILVVRILYSKMNRENRLK